MRFHFRKTTCTTPPVPFGLRKRAISSWERFALARISRKRLRRKCRRFSRVLQCGAVAPPVQMTTLDGTPLELGELKGKYVLLDFWATWCGPCIGEIPQLQAVYDTFGKDQRFEILSLSVDEKIDEPKKFQDKRRLPWVQAFLGGGVHNPTTATFGIRAIPAFVLVGPDGKIIARGMRGDDIKKEVARALAKKL